MMLGQLEVERLQELIGDDERAAAFLEQQLHSIRRRIASRQWQIQEATATHARTAAPVSQPIATAPPKLPLTSLSEALRGQGDKPAEQAPTKPETHDELFDRLNRVSGCGFHSAELWTRFTEYLSNHGTPGDWLVRNDLCRATHAWDQFGKDVADPILNRMEADGIIEIRSQRSGLPKLIRLKV
jgi:hypothetical protein